LAGNVSLTVVPLPKLVPNLVHDHVVLPLVPLVQLATIVIAPPVTGRLALPTVNPTEHPEGVGGGADVQFSVLGAVPPPLAPSVAATLYVQFNTVAPGAVRALVFVVDPETGGQPAVSGVCDHAYVALGEAPQFAVKVTLSVGNGLAGKALMEQVKD